MTRKIYLDYASSTPIDKKVLEAMMPYLKRHFGNPSSTHQFGQKARVALELAREQVASFLHCKAQEIIFTSGATEANNLAIQGVVKKYQASPNPPAGGKNSKPHIVTTAIEHESVLEPCRTLEKEGVAEVTYILPNREGLIKAEDVKKAIQPNTVLVSVMYVNSEVGTIEPIEEIGELLKGYPSTLLSFESEPAVRGSEELSGSRREGSSLRVEDRAGKILFHTDAVQAANFLECDVEKMGVDLLTLSGHKIYGPKGVGVLYRREKTFIKGIVEGGGQEGGLRSGTENVAAIAGMGAAVEELESPRRMIATITIRQLRDKLIKAVLRKIPDSELTGPSDKRLANNAHFRFEGVEGRDIVIMLDQKGIAVSTGSACSEKTQDASHVLLALGFSKKVALSSVRITLGKQTKLEEIEDAVRLLAQSVARLRKTGYN